MYFKQLFHFSCTGILWTLTKGQAHVLDVQNDQSSCLEVGWDLVTETKSKIIQHCDKNILKECPKEQHFQENKLTCMEASAFLFLQ